MSETTISRRQMIATVGLCAGAALLPSRSAHAARTRSGTDATFTTKDDTKLYYKDWGEGQPVVFSHGWPLSSDAWEDQMRFLAARGYRCIAHDRRGYGRSEQPWNGNDMTTHADDLAGLVRALELKAVIHVGHFSDAGEVARYIGRYGTGRVSKVVFISAVPALLAGGSSTQSSSPVPVFDEIRAGLLADRAEFFREFSAPYYGVNRPGATASQGLRDSFWVQAMHAGHKAAVDGVKAFLEAHYTADLQRIDVPTLILHGGDDQIVPLGASALRSAELLCGADYRIYEGAPHGICSTLKDRVNVDLLRFVSDGSSPD